METNLTTAIPVAQKMTHVNSHVLGKCEIHISSVIPFEPSLGPACWNGVISPMGNTSGIQTTKEIQTGIILFTSIPDEKWQYTQFRHRLD